MPRLGVTVVLMLVLLGNMAGAAVFDDFGWFGLPERPRGVGSNEADFPHVYRRFARRRARLTGDCASPAARPCAVP
ncbi:DMT family transporter [Hoeflea olei]|uniref:DMT family transporter n=1 Tax=Hoeflea olei TaxID=1480615 RepID=UPI003CC9FA2B